MADDKTATVNVPTELLKPIIEAKVVEALGGVPGLMEKFVDSVLNSKVRNSNTYKDESFIENTCYAAIQEAVRAAAKTWLAQNQDKLITAVERDMSKRTRSLATELVDGIVNASKDTYRLQVTLAVQPKKDY